MFQIILILAISIVHVLYKGKFTWMKEGPSFTELLKDSVVTCKANISVLKFIFKVCWMMPLLQI